MLVLNLHIPLAFICRNNTVAIHNLHKLVFSARLYMKMASWGFCVLVFDSSGEPVNRSEEMVRGVPYSYGAEFVIGRSTSEGEAASTGAPREIPSSLEHHCALFWQMRDHLIWFLFFQVQLVMFHISSGLALYRLKQK